MGKVVPGRMTHQHDGELVVFLIGMTINKPWRPDLWWPAFRAMPKMLRELADVEDSGLLGHRLMLEGRHPTLVQYWDSLDKLYEYANERDGEHWPAWRAFNRRAHRAGDAVGIWHETYLCSYAETVYVNTPELGLAKVTELTPLRRTEPLTPADAEAETDADADAVIAAEAEIDAEAEIETEADAGIEADAETEADAGIETEVVEVVEVVIEVDADSTASRPGTGTPPG